MVNVTGWNELLQGRVIMASRLMFEYYWGDWFITLLFLAFKLVLYFSTKSITLSFITSLIFLSVMNSYLDPQAFGIVVVIMVFELGGILYNAFWKK
jgi:hypothetical protein